MKKLFILVVVLCGACGSESPGQASAATAPGGVGPDGPESIAVPEVTVNLLDADKGKAVFAAKGCQACHRTDDQKLVGPGLKGVTARRTTKWLTRMIMAPEVMVKEDPVAKQLLATHMVPMSNQKLDPASEVPAVLAFLKSLE